MTFSGSFDGIVLKIHGLPDIAGVEKFPLHTLLSKINHITYQHMCFFFLRFQSVSSISPSNSNNYHVIATYVTIMLYSCCFWLDVKANDPWTIYGYQETLRQDDSRSPISPTRTRGKQLTGTTRKEWTNPMGMLYVIFFMYGLFVQFSKRRSMVS